MYVVAGVTGQTGSAVAETLLGQGKAVRVIVRSAEKGETWRARGAEVAVASLEDANSLRKAESRCPALLNSHVINTVGGWGCRRVHLGQH